ncbi:16S rRNA (cytosine(1402)-N(4))-methyltransferase RsmH [Pendulispora rubella]
MSGPARAGAGIEPSDPQLSLPGLVEGNVEWVWAEDEGEVNVVEHFVHATVMKDEVAQVLAPRDGGVYVDVTLGGGGHAEAILESAPGARVIGFDRDPEAIRATETRLERFEDRIEIVRSNFGRVREELSAMGLAKVDGLCADLGVSSPQLDDPLRGMSFRAEGPLDMRMDPEDSETALDLISRLKDDELADIIYRYGDERRSRRIARSIKRALDEGDLATTLDLRRAIVRAVGPVRVGGVDPATRTFQALRIAVNRELEELSTLLAALQDVVVPGGVAAVISFHSLEDRLVKKTFADREVWQPIWKKPLMASEEERAANPRSRSAKLRAARRISQDSPQESAR